MTSYMKKHQNLQIALSEFTQSVIAESLIREEINIVRENITILENDGVTLREGYENSRKDYNKVEVVYKRAQQDSNTALRAAKTLSDGFTPEDKGFDKFREKFRSLPKNDNALQNLIDELQTKVSCISTADEGEMREYEAGLQMISNLQTQLEEKSPMIQDIKNRRTLLYEEWINPLQELVGQINKNFGHYFESMGCAGEVEIGKEKGEMCFSEYGLVIRVTYRKEDALQELNR